MFDTKTRRVDQTLSRLASVVGRPWDQEEKSSVDYTSGSSSGSLPAYPLDDPDAPPRPWAALLRRLRPDPVAEDGDLPPKRPPRRWAVAAAAGAVVVGVLGAAVLVLPGSPSAPVGPLAPALPVAVETTPAALLVVDVQGKVAAPGLHRLPEGARVVDAIQASGGALPGTDTSGLNLARLLADGEQIHVGVPQPAEAVDESRPPLVDLNTAPVYQLDSLPGVGIVTAQRIVAYRLQHRFSRVEQLREVEGIGPSRYERLKDLVVVR